MEPVLPVLSTLLLLHVQMTNAVREKVDVVEQRLSAYAPLSTQCCTFTRQICFTLQRKDEETRPCTAMRKKVNYPNVRFS